MNKNEKTLFGLLVFNTLSSVGGGIAIMTGAIKQPLWVVHTGFSSLYFPGVILMAVVGGSSLIASLALMKNITGWRLSSLVAGVIMLFWIVGEIVSIRGFHWLQVIYLITGLGIIYFTPKKVDKFKRKNQSIR